MMANDRSHHSVEVDWDSMLVCKRFLSAVPGEAAQRAQREFAYLQRFATVLAPERFIRCPEPIRVEPEQGTLWMTYCPGSQLHHTLAEPDDSIEEHLEHLGEQIASATNKYVREFDQPHLGLSTWNMLYDMSTRTLTLVDFTGHPVIRHVDTRDAALDVTVGVFIGTSTYHTVRWRRRSWRNQAYWRRQRRLSTLFLDRLRADRALSGPVIKDSSERMYAALTRDSRPRRRLWFATVGGVLFNRRVNAIVDRSCRV